MFSIWVLQRQMILPKHLSLPGRLNSIGTWTLTAKYQTPTVSAGPKLDILVNVGAQLTEFLASSISEYAEAICHDCSQWPIVRGWRWQKQLGVMLSMSQSLIPHSRKLWGANSKTHICNMERTMKPVMNFDRLCTNFVTALMFSQFWMFIRSCCILEGFT